MSVSQEQQPESMKSCGDPGNPVSSCMINAAVKGTPTMSVSQEQQPDGMKSCADPGNPVFSCMLNTAVKGVGMSRTKAQSILYRTTSRDYGRLPPTFATAPSSYHPRSQRFTQEMRQGGMYRDNSLNTSLNRSRVHDCSNLQHTI